MCAIVFPCLSLSLSLLSADYAICPPNVLQLLLEATAAGLKPVSDDRRAAADRVWWAENINSNEGEI